MADCLIVAVAVSAGIPVLARDRDFTALPAVVGLALDAGSPDHS